MNYPATRGNGPAAVILFVAMAASVARAATFDVNDVLDAVDVTPGNGVCATATFTCTLRAAIQEANGLAGADTINLPAGNYVITIVGGDDIAAQGDLDITQDLTIFGAGAASTTVDGNGATTADRTFDVHSGIVAISGVTIRGGNIGNKGGGVRNFANLTLTDSIVTSNTANEGGGIHVESAVAVLTLDSVTLVLNTASKGGGMRLTTDGATATLTDVTIDRNVASGQGGGIAIEAADATLDRVLFVDNDAIDGGGLWTKAASCDVGLTNVTFSGNDATSEGGGIWAEGNTLPLVNVTLTNNTAVNKGGAIRPKSGSVTLTNTILSGNTPDNCERAVTSAGNNIDSGATCSLPAGESNIDPLLGPLQDNGGPTLTHELLTGSPAIEGGTNTGCPAVDQRGVTRPIGALCDVGAFEATVYSISGKIFEDANFAGMAADWDGGGSDRALENVDVELYDGGGSYLASTVTDGSGDYAFWVTDGNYRVRARSATIGDDPAGPNATPPKGGFNACVPATCAEPLPEMTWGAGTAMYGGQSPTVDDTATADNAGVGDTWVAVTVSGVDETGVNLGFAYNLIVNTFDDMNDPATRSVQGGLRQFIKNANAIGSVGGTTANTSEFRIPITDPGYTAGTGVFSIDPPADLTPLTDAGTTLDGSTQTANVGNTNTAVLGVGGTVGVDGLALGTVAGPEIELRGAGARLFGIRIEDNNATIRGLAIYGFGAAGTGEGSIHLANDVTGALIEDNVIGSGAAAFVDPVTTRSFENVYSGGADSGTIRNNLIGFGGIRGILLTGGSNGWTVSGNEIRDCSLESTGGDGIAINDSTSISLTGNLIVGSASQGYVVTGSGTNTFTNNTVTGNGVGISTVDAQSGGITMRPGADDNTLDRNVINANYGSGIVVNDGAAGTIITRNSIYDNGTIVARNGDPPWNGIGIDLGETGDDINLGQAPFVTLNDPGDAILGGNALRNFPVLDTALLSGPNLELTGWALPGSVIELFVTDGDASGFGEGQTWKITLTEGGTGAGGEDPYPDTDPATNDPYTGTINGLNQGDDNTNRFKFTFPAAGITAATELTATARHTGNTSEFSGRVVVGIQPADLSLIKTDNPDPAPLDGPLVYTLIVTNNGPGTATGVTVTDTLPASVTLASATPSQGSCSGTTTVTCNLGAIVASGTASVELLVTTTATGMINNSASVTANEPDPVAANDTAAEGTEVVADSSVIDVPLTQYRRLHGFLDYTVTGGTLRTQPNGPGGAACQVGPNSTAALSGIPATATITNAYLYWGGSGATVDANVTLDGGAIVADRTFQGRFSLGANDYEFFGGFEDVTTQITTKRNGSYTFADLTVDTGDPNCKARAVIAGWSLFVVYEDNTLSGKTLLLYDGFDIERNGSTNYVLTGIFAADPPEAKATYLLWEGDPDLGGTSELLEFNGTTLTDGFNPVDNAFNSTINTLASNTSYGVDLDTFDVSSEVAAGDTLATTLVSVSSDLVILNAAVLQVKSNIIVGHVFEDVNYGGGVGRNRAAATADAPSFAVDRPGVVVELYDPAGNFLRTTTTSAAGQYGFAGLVDGDYQVRVVNETVVSSRPGAVGTELPVQTYRTDASSGAAVPVVVEVGGADTTAQDSGPNAGMVNLSAITAQSVAPAKIVTGIAVLDVDFGFNFSVVVNTNGTGQGSLHQFILNSNNLN